VFNENKIEFTSSSFISGLPTTKNPVYNLMCLMSNFPLISIYLGTSILGYVSDVYFAKTTNIINLTIRLDKIINMAYSIYAKKS
jgi:hypothetical protein